MVTVPARNRLLIANESARFLFEAVLAGVAVDDLPTLLVEHYGIDPQRAVRDVAAAFAGWSAAGVLEDQAAAPQRPPASAPPAGPATFSRLYALAGRKVRVEADGPALAGALERLLAPLRSSGRERSHATIPTVRAVEAPDGSFIVEPGGGESRRAADHDLALGEIINALIDLAHPGVRWLAIVHASAVVMGGGAVVMAGPSGSGKSTLCAALTQSGHRYMSDDVVPVAADGRAYPVPLAQSLKRGSWRVLAERVPGLPDPSDTARSRQSEHYRTIEAGMTADTGMKVAAFVVPRYVPGAVLEHRTLDPFSTFSHLIRARSWISLERADLERLLTIIRETRSFELIYSSLDEAIAFLERLQRN